MANVLSSFLDMFKAKAPSVLGVDIGSSAIKIVQLRKKSGQAVLETYGSLALGPYANLPVGKATRLSPETLTQALVDLIKEANVGSRDASIAIPLSGSLISVIKLPNMDERNLAQVIPLEARKYIPVPITEVALSWWPIPVSSDVVTPAPGTPPPPLEVLVVAVHNDLLRREQGIATNASLTVGFFELETFSTARASLDRGMGTSMIFDMGAATTKLALIDGGMLRYSHTINRGSQDLTNAVGHALNIGLEDAERLKRGAGLLGERPDVTDIFKLHLDYIFSEANRVLVNYEQKYKANVRQVILTGGGVLLKGLLPIAQESLDTEVVLANPFGKVGTPAFLEDTLKLAGPEFAVAVGLALRRLQEVG